MMKVFLTLSFILSGMAGESMAQSAKADFAFLLARKPALKEVNLKNETPVSAPRGMDLLESPFRFALQSTLFGYQRLISSQDAPTCIFSPSCSRFGRAAIKRAGAMRGLLLTADRLQRCHGFHSSPLYPVNHTLNKFSDPIDAHIPKKKND